MQHKGGSEEGYHLSYLSIGITRHHDQGNVKHSKLIGAYSFKGKGITIIAGNMGSK